MTERRADDATRDVQSWLKCEYLQDHVGDQFDGVIAAVTSFGLFVELSGLYIEGLVHISALPGDYYQFDSAKQHLVGERSGRSYKLGGHVQVQVARVDLDDKKVDLELLESQPPRKAKKSKSGNKAKADTAAEPGRKKNKKQSSRKSKTGLRRHH